MNKTAYKIIQGILGVIFRPLFLFEIRGLENVPEGDGYIVCANHKSMWDPVFLTITLKEPINYMGKKELFENKIFNKIARGLGAFPVDRNNMDIRTLKDSIKRIKEGQILGIMPEGTRTKNIDRENMKDGVAYIALKAEADILPVEIVSKFRPFSKTYIYIKKPIKIDRYQDMKSKEAMVKVTDKLFSEIYGQQLKRLESR